MIKVQNCIFFTQFCNNQRFWTYRFIFYCFPQSYPQNLWIKPTKAPPNFLENVTTSRYPCHPKNIWVWQYIKIISKWQNMKKETHPEYKEIKVTCSCGNSFVTKSTLLEDLAIEVCSSCHPFYTGQQKIVDTAGRVDKFRKRFGIQS